MRREAQNNLQTQVTMIKETYDKVANIHSHIGLVEKIAKTQAEISTVLIQYQEKTEQTIKELSKTMTESLYQPKNKNHTQLKPPNLRIGRIEINMIQLKNLGRNFKTKYLENKPPMNWNRFGEEEWQIIERAIENQTLTSVRYQDIYKEGDNPRGKTYEIPKWENLVTVNNFCQKFDVFNEAWINLRERQGYKFLSHGLFQCRIQGLHGPDLDIRVCVILVDERKLDFKKRIIGIGQLDLH